jgi:hypothetical protein
VLSSTYLQIILMNIKLQITNVNINDIIFHTIICFFLYKCIHNNRARTHIYLYNIKKEEKNLNILCMVICKQNLKKYIFMSSKKSSKHFTLCMGVRGIYIVKEWGKSITYRERVCIVLVASTSWRYPILSFLMSNASTTQEKNILRHHKPQTNTHDLFSLRFFILKKKKKKKSLFFQYISVDCPAYSIIL